MATSSIFANVKITDKDNAKVFVDALDNAYKNPSRMPTTNVYPPLSDKEAIKSLFAKRLDNK